MNKNLAQKIAIIGAGSVGSTIAYTVMLKNLASQLILIDINDAKEAGEVMDIADGLSLAESGAIKGADFKDARDADIIVLTAGAAQKPGETRLSLIGRNHDIVKSIFKKIGTIKKDAVIIVVTNPVDVITALVQKLAGLPKNQVFGTSTCLETARLKTNLANRFKVHAQSIHGYVLGEHGDSGFVAWNTVTIGGVPIRELIKSQKELDKIEKEVKNEVYEIINRKGATFYGIAMVVADVIEAVVLDQHKIMPVSNYLCKWNGADKICLGAPAIVGAGGIIASWPLKLDATEKKKFMNSVNKIKQYL